MRNESRKHKALTMAEVLAEAEKYTTRTEFSRGSGGAYNKARAEGYLDLACAHMSRKPYPTSLTYEKVKACAAKYKTRSDFLLNSQPEYNKAVREGWLSEICSHMPAHIGIKWDFAAVKKEAAKYKHRVDFMVKSQSAYKRAIAEGWINKVCKHMVPKERRGVWPYKEVARVAKKYKHRSDFSLHAKGAYSAALRQGWIDDVCKHMTPKPYTKKS